VFVAGSGGCRRQRNGDQEITHKFLHAVNVKMCIPGVICGQVPLFDLLYSYLRAQGLSLFFEQFSKTLCSELYVLGVASIAGCAYRKPYPSCAVMESPKLAE
jgi:hypothetical protein